MGYVDVLPSFCFERMKVWFGDLRIQRHCALAR